VIWGVKHFFGTQYKHAFVYLNILLFGLTVFFVFKIWRLVQPRFADNWIIALLIGLGVIFGLLDVPLWSYWILTDNMFLTVVTGFVYFVVWAVARGSKGAWLGASFICVFALLVRPTAVVLPLIFALAFPAVVATRKWGGRGTLVLMVCLAGIVFFYIPWLVYLELNGASVVRPVSFLLSDKIVQALPFYKNGWVVANQADTYQTGATDYLDFVKITLLRFGYYYIPVKSTYSFVHNIVNSIYWVSVLVIGYIGWRGLMRGSIERQAVASWLVLFAFFYGLLHAVTVVSYEWRYQLPAMIPVWVMAGIGGKIIWEDMQSWMAARRERNALIWS